MKGKLTIPGILLIILIAGLCSGGDLMLNYEGRVRSNGIPFSGKGSLKFVLLAKQGVKERPLWTSDGTTTDSVPQHPVSVDVSNGFFSVLLGDESIPNMTSLCPTLFNEKGDLYIRAWFNSELLQPDRRIAKSSLLDVFTIYVDAEKGDDDFPGTSPEKPKKSIQAAIDVMPKQINGIGEIRIADGVYREELSIVDFIGSNGTKDKVAKGLNLIGNESDPSKVRLTGSFEGYDDVPVRPLGIYMNNSKIRIRGITINYFREDGIELGDSFLHLENTTIEKNLGRAGYCSFSSVIKAVNCKFNNNDKGFYSSSSSKGLLYDCSFNDNHTGIFTCHNSYVYLSNCELNKNSYGLQVRNAANADCVGCFIDGNTESGVLVERNAWVNFSSSTKTQISKNKTGIIIRLGGSAYNISGSGITFSGNNQDLSIDKGTYYTSP